MKRIETISQRSPSSEIYVLSKSKMTKFQREDIHKGSTSPATSRLALRREEKSRCILGFAFLASILPSLIKSEYSIGPVEVASYFFFGLWMVAFAVYFSIGILKEGIYEYRTSIKDSGAVGKIFHLILYSSLLVFAAWTGYAVVRWMLLPSVSFNS